MISVINAGVRSELGLGFGAEVMEDGEFGEESTHSYVSCADPDLTLSYIDERLEKLLGQFQKDFEGPVSAENLGAKFGGYGSFLSMYQRSPVCSQPKTPPQVQNNVGGRSNCSVSSSESASKTPASDVSVKLQKFVISSTNIWTSCDSKQKSDTRISSSSSATSNHKPIRFYLKVGSSDLSSLKNVSSNKSDSRSAQDVLAVSDSQKHAGKFSIGKKKSSKGKINYMPQSNKLDRNHIVSNTEKEIDKVSDSNVETTSRGRSKTEKHGLENNVVEFSDRSVKVTESINTRKDIYLKKSEPLHSLESKYMQEKKAPSVKHVEDSAVVSQSEIRHEEKLLMTKLPKGEKSQKSSSSIVTMRPLRGKKGRMENKGLKSEKETSRISKKPKTRTVDKPGSYKYNKLLEVSAKIVKDIAKASSHGKRDDRKRKRKETKQSADCLILREAATMDSKGENARKKRKLKGPSCDEKELPFSVSHKECSQNQKQNGSRHKDHVDFSPLKKESTCQAVIKEATDLKHTADRLMNAGSFHESTSLYFEAALKFLHGASLLESSGADNTTHESLARSKHIYSSTAKLCEFCAHEYEKDKDMGAAALAYKCMEIAYLRITYATHGNIRRCRNELQAALQVSSSGHSPSLASDGENINHTEAAEKVALSNTMRSSPSATGNHVISSGNSSLSQLLAFSQNTSLPMDASRKAQIAFAAAKKPLEYSSDAIKSIKRALDFHFEDMEKLLHVMRLAMESINEW